VPKQTADAADTPKREFVSQLGCTRKWSLIVVGAPIVFRSITMDMITARVSFSEEIDLFPVRNHAGYVITRSLRGANPESFPGDGFRVGVSSRRFFGPGEL
jgi:hypothetical protein